VIDEDGGKPYRADVHRLLKDAHGSLVFIDELGHHHVGVIPVQAFPIDSPGEHLSLVSTEGHELAFVPALSDLDAETCNFVLEEIAQREFIPVIERLISVSTFSTPTTWSVRTDRGMSSFVLKGEEDIRRVSAQTLIVADAHGVQFLIRDLPSLNASSRKLLDRFL
jgi:hypothetical protein